MSIPKPSIGNSFGSLSTLAESEKLSISQEFQVNDLARSGLTTEDMLVVPRRAVTENDKNVGNYQIIYCNRSGKPIFLRDGLTPYSRTRFDREDPKYLCPRKEEAGPLLVNVPYFCHKTNKDEAKHLGQYLLVEGEKKYAKLWKEERTYGCAIGGKDTWHQKDNDELHPVLEADIKDFKPKQIIVVPDGDWQRQDVGASWNGLLAALRRTFPDVEVHFADLSRFPKGKQKVDDYLVAGGKWVDVPLLLNPELPEASARLIRIYNLYPTPKGGIARTEANITKLLRHHPYFAADKLYFDANHGKIVWHETDTKNHLAHQGLYMQLLLKFQTLLSMHDLKLETLGKCVDYVACERLVYPLRGWLDQCHAEWVLAGKPDILPHYLREHLGAVPSEFDVEAWTHCMIGAVAIVYEPGCKLDEMMVLIGEGGIRKTEFINDMFGKEDVSVVIGDLKDKDLYMLVGSRWVANIEELHTYQKKDPEFMKGLLTLHEYQYRPPYGKTGIALPRANIFIANADKRTVLKGNQNRREWPVEITRRYDRQQLLADRNLIVGHAVDKYRNGEPWWFENPMDYERDKAAFTSDFGLMEVVREYLDENRGKVFLYKGHPVFRYEHMKQRVATRLGRASLNDGVLVDILGKVDLYKHEQRRVAQFAVPPGTSKEAICTNYDFPAEDERRFAVWIEGLKPPK